MAKIRGWTILALWGLWMLAGCNEEVASAGDETATIPTTPYEEAVAQATATGQLVLLDFTGSDWCPPCMALEREVLTQPAFAEALGEKGLLVKLDFPRDREKLPAAERQRNYQLQDKYGIEAYPTVVVVDAEGNEVSRQVGYNNGAQERWLGWLASVLAAEG